MTFQWRLYVLLTFYCCCFTFVFNSFCLCSLHTYSSVEQDSSKRLNLSSTLSTLDSTLPTLDSILSFFDSTLSSFSMKSHQNCSYTCYMGVLLPLDLLSYHFLRVRETHLKDVIILRNWLAQGYGNSLNNFLLGLLFRSLVQGPFVLQPTDGVHWP